MDAKDLLQMDAKDVLPIVFERSNAMVTLWNMEIVVVLGLIAFLATAGEMMGHPSIELALTLGFLGMAAFNVEGLIKVAEQRRALADFFRTLKFPLLAACSDYIDLLVDYFRAGKSPSLAACSGWIDPLLVPPLWLVVSVHGVADLMVVLLIWFYPPPPRKPAS